MENLLNEKLVEAIIMSASVGQFSQQLVEETFSQAWQKLDEAKKQMYNVGVSGLGALTTYGLTQDQFVIKAAGIAFLSGIFATTALKLLKKKNQGADEKASQVAEQLKQLEIQVKDDRIKQLEKELSDLQAAKVSE